MGYPAIADHGLIGDLQSSALVSVEGTIDWFCCPRVDSPSVFAALLDETRGGRFALRPAVAPETTKQMYLPDTAILVTRYLGESGIAEVLDFMPIDDPGVASHRRRLVRVVRGIRGEVEFEARVEPRFDYGRSAHRCSVAGTTAVFESPELSLHLGATVPLEADGDDVRATFTSVAGSTDGFVLESMADGTTPTAIGDGQVLRLFRDTETYWKEWLEHCTYRGRWREAVERSAITLKLMTYAPTGALVAAPTAGLPEQIGGARNWDYRFTWVRDSSFSVYALLGLGSPRRRQPSASGCASASPRPMGAPPDRSRSCTGSPAARTSSRRRSITSTATWGRARCASATPRRTSCSSTSTARR